MKIAVNKTSCTHVYAMDTSLDIGLSHWIFVLLSTPCGFCLIDFEINIH